MRTPSSRFMVLLPTLFGLTLASFSKIYRSSLATRPFSFAAWVSVRVLGFALLLLVASPRAGAQFAQRGGIAGTVFDASGAVVPGAEVTLVDSQNQSRQIAADKAGHFEFSNLIAGQYILTASHEGFQTEKSQSIAVNIGSVANYDFRLHAGSTRETVTVTAESAGLETEQTSVETNITARQFEELPLNGRNFTSIAALAPGVATYPQANVNPGGTYSVGSQFAFGGTAFTTGGSFQGSRDNGFYINGVNANDNYVSSISFAPSAEAIGTGTIQVSDFSAAVGHDISALNIQTKGGGSKFHGEAYDFLENTDLNAVNPWANAYSLITIGTPAIKPALIRNQFGGNLGGPIPIPGFKNKLFFFVNYEDFRERDGNSEVTASVPSAAERTGDFSELLCGTPACDGGSGANPNPIQLYNPLLTTYDPTTGVSSRPPIAGNRLDQVPGLVNPASAAILNALYPLPNIPNTPSNQVNYFSYQSSGIANYHLDTRFDARITANDNLFVTWSKSSGSNNFEGGIQPTVLYTYPVQDQSYLITVNYAHIFTPHLTNEFIFGTGDGALVTASSSQLSYFNSSNNPLNKLFQNTGAGITQGVFGIYGNNYPTPGIVEFFRAENESWQFSDNVDWVRGRHSLSAGFNYFRKSEIDWDVARNVQFGTSCNPYSGTCTNAFSASGGDLGYQGGDAMADLVLGSPGALWIRYTINGGNATSPNYNILFPYWGFYVNDKFHLSSKLTISAGLRWDLSIPDYTPNPAIAPCCAIYSSAPGTPSGGVLEYPGIAAGLPIHYRSADKRDFAPRIAIAYTPNPKTVIRAGYGIFYNAGASQISTNVGNAIYGTSSAVNYNEDNATLGQPVDTPYLTLSSIFPTPLSTTLGSFPAPTGKGQGTDGPGALAGLTYYDQKSTPLPYYQRMLLDVQRQVTAHDVFVLSYAGVQGRKGMQETNINLPPYQTGWPSGGGAGDPAYNAARPNNTGYFGDIYVMRPRLNSFYNAMIVQYRHDFSRGFQATSNYTWGKTVSDYPASNSLGVVGGFQYPNVYDRGESTQSHRHRFVFSGIWSPEYGKAWPVWARLPLSGWRLSGTMTLESGDALTISNGGPGTPCPSSDAGTTICPTGFGSSPQDGAGFSELNASGNPNISHGDKSFYRQFNTSVFSVPAQNVRGNSGLGTVRGPGQNRADLSLAKTFPIRESLHLEFRADAFNVFNHSNWNSVVTTYPSGSTQFPFGMVNGANEARIVQVAGKVVF
jgi:Carboxypeptidase regulatory-like domain/TonB dependent receptor